LSRGTSLQTQNERNMIMKAFKRLVVMLVVSALIGIGALGCNTIKGAGKDVEKGGKGIQNAADGAQKK
jgi:predicted small secreted protein